MIGHRVVALTGLVGILAVGCTTGGRASRTVDATTKPVALVQLANIPGGPHEQVPSALDDPTARGLPNPLVHPSDIHPGGPPPDGIKPVDRPLFQRADTVTWLSPDELVLALELHGDARAYPIQVMIWHEIANDTVGGVPVSVTYCPLCNSAIAFDRRAAGRVLTFGTSGELYNSDLVAYDRQTRSLWVQFLGRAVAGVLTGTTLRAYPVQTVSWRQWRHAHPSGWVLGRVDVDSYEYGDNPYPGYDAPHAKPFLFTGSVDRRLPATSRVVGLNVGGDAVAVSFDVLRVRHVVTADTGGGEVTVWWTPGGRSPLSADRVSVGSAIGTTGVFNPQVGSRTLHFTAGVDGFIDDGGSRWNVFGRAVSGPLTGRQLRPVAHLDAFWFAWAAFHPETRLIR